MEILVTNQSEIDLELDGLKNVAAFVLSEEKVAPDSEISVALVNSKKMQELNLKYRQIDRPTDVLSFDLSDDGKISGEVVISPQVAFESVADDVTEQLAELESLLIHGLLHLLGYTHDQEDDAEVMFDRHQRLSRGSIKNKENA